MYFLLHELWPTFSHVAYLERDWSSPLIIKCISFFTPDFEWSCEVRSDPGWPLAVWSASLPPSAFCESHWHLFSGNKHLFLLRQTQASSGACPEWFSEGRSSFRKVFLSEVTEWERLFTHLRFKGGGLKGAYRGRGRWLDTSAALRRQMPQSRGAKNLVSAATLLELLLNFHQMPDVWLSSYFGCWMSWLLCVEKRW